jgi:Ca-activated chloride channel homolog
VPGARERTWHLLSTMRLLITSLVITLSAVAHGQQPHFSSASSHLVVLAASVTDKEGGFVPELEQERFTVFDNGKRRPISLFSNDDTPVSVGLILDNSGSMKAKIGEVVAATAAFARASHPEDELFALAFNDDVREAVPGRRFLLASDFTSLEQSVSSLRPDGQTSLYDAIIKGLDRLDEGSRARKVLIVMSDGGDNASRATLDQVLARARRSDATIYTIGLFDADDPDRNPGVLKELAQTTGGERFLPASAGPLLQACRRIAQDIRSGYTIAFEPSGLDNTYHRIRVEIARTNGRRLDVRTRPGYVALSPPQPKSGKAGRAEK